MSRLDNRNGNPLFLSHNGTCCIYQSDLHILDSDSEWLNDSCINFQMVRLSEAAMEAKASNETQLKQRKQQHMKNYDHDDGEEDKVRVVLMDPCIVSFFMHQISVDDEEDRDEIIGLFKNTWELGSCQCRDDRVVAMMIPINDNHAGSSWSFQTPGAGNHWSLLLVLIYTEDLHEGVMARHRQRSNYARYFHLDSSRQGNAAAARTVATRVESILSIGVAASESTTSTTGTNPCTVLTNSCSNTNDSTSDEIGTHPLVNDTAPGTSLPSSTSGKTQRTSLKRMATSVGVVECSTPQQSNGHDCGLCTLANAEALSKAIDSLPKRRPSVVEDGEGDVGRNVGGEEDDDKKLRKWIEFTLKEFVGKYGGMSKMTRTIRRRIAADVRHLKVSSG